MKKVLENYFGCQIETEEYRGSLELPVYMAVRKIEIVKLFHSRFAVINISEDISMTSSAMKKQQERYEQVLQMPVAFQVKLNSVTMRNSLVKKKIAFLSLPNNVFLPFLGIVLQEIHMKKVIHSDKMMPATQMVFLELLYQKSSEGLTKSQIAEKLNLTKTSITRATVQLEEMNLILQQKHGKEIKIFRNASPRAYYENAKRYLINPIQKMKEVKWEKCLESVCKAGESALSYYSSLNPPAIEEKAIYKGSEIIDQLELEDVRFTEARCVRLQMWKYDPYYFAQNGVADPVSLICSLREIDDERIEMCIEELLEELDDTWN